MIDSYFRNIFQSPKITTSPRLNSIEHLINQYDVFNPSTDQPISLQEVQFAIQKLGSGTSFDGLPPELVKIFPLSIVKCIHEIHNKIFDSKYPNRWKTQMLFPVTKKGHTTAAPKLRGIAIGPILSRIYDIVLNNRFKSWYEPNVHQAGFRAGQGCNFQLFALFLLIDMAWNLGVVLFICLIDFEKAFDFMNRAELLKQLMNLGIGKKFLNSLKNIYLETSYRPKISSTSMGDEIVTDYGVTQGKSSSANLFSCFISDMPQSVQDCNVNDFMDPLNVLQLADDSSILADKTNSLCSKTKNILDYYDAKYLHANVPKTK